MEWVVCDEDEGAGEMWDEWLRIAATDHIWIVPFEVVEARLFPSGLKVR
jgi:hypothetical protein